MARPNPRDELIAIALEMLDGDHPEDLSIREVARRAGLTSGAPYHHFGDKVGLLAACAEVAWEALCTQLEDVDEGASLEAAVHHKASVYIDYALSNPGAYRLMTSRLLVEERFAEVAALRMRAMRDLVALIASSVPVVPDPKWAWRRSMAVWSLLHGYVTLVIDGAVAATKQDALTQETCRMAARLALLDPS